MDTGEGHAAAGVGVDESVQVQKIKYKKLKALNPCFVFIVRTISYHIT